MRSFYPPRGRSPRFWRYVGLLLATGSALWAWPAAGSPPPPPALGRPAPQVPRHWAEAALARVDSLLPTLPDSLPPGETARGRWDLELERLWALYHLAVEDKGRLRHLEEALARLTHRAPKEDQEFLTALGGAGEVLQARHARWPPAKLEHLKRGLGSLDRAVSRSPEDPRIRYLRLVSGYHLPAFLGRKEEVQADFRALFALLPEGTGAFPSGLFPLVVGFVLERGSPPAAVRDRLAGVLEGRR